MSRDRRLTAAERRVAKLRLPERVEEQFGPFKHNPTGFCRDMLGVVSATRRSTGAMYQFEILEDVDALPRVAVKTGHGTGKTALDSWACLWWLATRPLSRVIVLAPEFSRQIRAILFSEARKWARRARVRLPLDVLASRILVKGYGEEWSATGMSTAGDAAKLEGFHAEGGVLVLVDEMKAVPQDAFDAIQGALSGLEDSRLLVTSVPGGAGAGPFWKACSDPEHWRVHHVPSSDSSLVSAQWLEDRAKDWGRGSPLYQCRVAGEFADSGEGVLFPLQLLEAACARGPNPETKRAGLGVDVARSVTGDLNVVAKCEQAVLSIVRTWREPDTMKTVGRVLHIVAESGIRGMAVDVGGPGGGVKDRLAELGHTVRGEAFGAGAHEKHRFRNRRAELLWRLRDGLEKGLVALQDDDEVRADLSALRYEFTPAGLIQIESKDDVRTRLGRSPDRGDALALAWSVVYGPGAADDVPAAALIEMQRSMAKATAWEQSQPGYGQGSRELRSIFDFATGRANPGGGFGTARSKPDICR